MHHEDGFAAEDRRPAGGNFVQTFVRPRLRMHNASPSVLQSTAIRMFKQLIMDLVFIRIFCYGQ